MKLRTISINNLRRRKAKMAFLTIGLMVGIATIVTLLTLTASMSSDIGKKMDEFGANILIMPQSNDLSMSYGGISLGRVTFDQREIREADLAKIATIKNNKNILAVSPKVLGGVRLGDRDALLVGVNFDNELKMKQWWRIFGELPKKEGEILLGSSAADTAHLTPGDTVQLGGRSVTVAGVLEQTGSQDDSLVFMPLAGAQKLLGKEGRITLVEVAALCSGCPIGDMVVQIAEKLPEAKVTAIQQVVESRLQTLDHFKRFAFAVAGVVIFIGSLIVFVTMMGSVTERTTEIGVFRAIGFRRNHIIRIILLEAALVSLLAGILGYLAGMGGAKAVLPFMAETRDAALVWDTTVMAGSIALSLIVGMAASLYPALHASRIDPTEALRAL
ncbi:ABC transporter permease [Geobacter benzoatilyticus]|uniref:ABC transporter permease n=1 Tax=Geobacter benzoatilyticus TaxID=2815309 RepID=A0ABX7Q1R6_9BACT|nr:ABC transporter permease [Geobacter benzoatilyticus]QSV45339.1 ABC transporter permease [Geobacter benzoatilyticus]